MTTDVTTVVGQFSIVNGIWHNDASNQVAIREPKSSDVMGAGKGDLFVLTEVHGRDVDLQAIEQQLAEISWRIGKTGLRRRCCRRKAPASLCGPEPAVPGTPKPWRRREPVEGRPHSGKAIA